MKTLIKWIAAAVVIAVVLGVAHEPAYWRHKYFGGLQERETWVAATGRPGFAGPVTGIADDAPLAFFKPREPVPGGNQPPVPRQLPSAENLDAKALESAAEYAAAYKSRAFIVSRNGYLVFERYWKRTNYDTVDDGKALARVLTALAAGAAISERKIGWPDEPIGHFITEWRDDPRGQITVRDLMQLSSGLAPEEGTGAAEPTTDIIANYLKRPLVAAPGKQWMDQTTDADLLAEVIQRATKQRYAQYLSQAIWQRIGAADASLWLDRPGGAARIDRGFLVHQGDWIRVGELLLANGNYLGDEVLVPRWEPQMLAPSSGNSHYGSFIHLGAHAESGMTPYAAPDVLVVEGGGNRLWLVPSLHIAILRIGDAPDASDWDEARIPNLVIRGARDFVAPVARPGADLRQLVPNH